MAVRQKAVASWRIALARWAFNASGYNRYGLMTDDCIHETDAVKEALNRLPKQTKDERNFRIARALQLSVQKVVLPKEEWVKYEEDVRYLMPVLEQVKKEMVEKAEWNSK